jgi:serine/threonine-protein kinase
VHSTEFLALQEVVVGRYSLIRELGRGGMGVVFLAREVALERPVAIKLLPPSFADVDAHRARFVREAKTAAALAHPNIVPIHSVEEHANIVFFVMGFVDGETLAQRVVRDGPLPSSILTRVVQEVSWALAHAHAHGVVHRDVKPENILLERGTDRAIVTDFGIAWVDEVSGSTGPGKIVGTPRYMSPEQASGEPLDGRSDVYSLGAVAFFAATGRPPIDGPSTPAILAKVLTESAPPLGSIRRSLPPRFAAAIDRCLAKAPGARWPSAETLAASLRSMGNADVEVAQPVRTFLREADGAGAEIGTGLTLAATSLLMLLIATAGPTHNFAEGLDRVFSLILYLGSAASMAGLAGWRFAQLVAQTRTLLRAGYGHSAMKAALAATDRSDGDRRTTMQRWRSALAGLVAGTAATIGAVWLTNADVNLLGQLIGMGGSIVAPAMTARHLLRHAQTGDRWWIRLIRGGFGRRVFKLAGIGLPAGRALPAAGEPTSVALGSALGNLYDALPADVRKRFGELPALVEELERAAAELRLQTPSPEEDGRGALIVGALEALRLDLLRLHAESGSPDDLTRDLEAAARISNDIAAQLAKRDVDRSVGFTPLPS